MKNSIFNFIGVILFFITIFTFSLQSFASNPKWLTKLNKLKIFQSTRDDVETLFFQSKITDVSNLSQKEKNGWGLIIDYETPDGDLEVSYSTGNCSVSKSRFGYDINKNIIYRIVLFPVQQTNYKNLNYDFRKFEMEIIDDISEGYVLTNKDKGVRIVIESKIITSIEFYPTNKNEELDCEKFTK